MIRIVSTCLVAGMVVLVSQGAVLRAQTAPAQVAKEREDVMKSLWGGYYRDMSQAAKGEGDLKAVVVKATQANEQLKKFGTLFPPGSGRDAVPATRAKPEIWTQRAEFDAALNDLMKETAAFGDAAKAGNIEAVKVQWTKVAQACGGCHGGPSKSGGKFRFEEP
ncbi:MAG: cytochrome c [Pseudolabrys sp.]|jgi:cytochrome c556